MGTGAIARAVVMGVAAIVVAACAPAPTPNLAPVAAATADPQRGTAPLVVQFSSAGTVDPDGSIRTVSWDFGDGSATVLDAEPRHTYGRSGRFVARVTVTDDRGATDATEVTIDVAPEPVDWASPVPLDVHVTDTALARATGAVWDQLGLREPGAAVFDPATATWILTYTGRGNIVAGNSAITASIGASLSVDGTTWSPHPQNPISSAAEGEDPYLVKDAATGALWRDHDGHALMFSEEKEFGTHRGVLRWRSAPGTLEQWQLDGRVVDRGLGWDATDRTSPVVLHDAGRLVMLFEGRNLPEQQGAIGLATSDDGGATWTAAPSPIIDKGAAGAWNEVSIVPDDLVKVGDAWVLLAHGLTADGTWSVGRYVTSAPPSEWNGTSFSELPGNPVAVGIDTLMAFGDRGDEAVQVSADGQAVERLVLRRRDG